LPWQFSQSIAIACSMRLTICVAFGSVASPPWMSLVPWQSMQPMPAW
jgi:hypothetical protein